MARNVILSVREGDPACDRARELVARVARELGLELEVRAVEPSPGEPVPQLVLWDGTHLDRLDDEGALRDAVTAKIWAEDATAGAAGPEQDRFAREEAEHRAGGERVAKARSRRKKPVLREVRGEIPSGEGPPFRERGSTPPARTPVVLRGGRRGRWDLARRLARKVRKGGVPVLFFVLFLVAAVTLGSREVPRDEAGPGSEGVALAAPPLHLPTLDGFRFDLARESGCAVLLVPFDARKANRDGLLALGAEAERVRDLSRGYARIVAIGVGLGPAELRAALPDLPFALTVAADADGVAMRAFASVAGQGAGWWLVDRSGRVVGRGGQPGPDAFAALLASARGAR